MSPPRQYFSPQEVGNITGLSASCILQEIKAGEIQAVLIKLPGRTRGRWRIAVADAHAYAAKIGIRHFQTTTERI